MARALRDLPLNLRVVVVLRYYAGLSRARDRHCHSETAGNREIPPARGAPSTGCAPSASSGGGHIHNPGIGGSPVTMIDEEEITRLLLQLGDTFEVSGEARQ